MQVRELLLTFAPLMLAAHSCFAAETICLKSGFCLEAESHSTTADAFVLHLGSGTVEISPQDIDSIQVLQSGSQSDTSSQQAGSLTPATTTSELLSKAARQQGLGAYTDFVRSVAKIESGLCESAVSPKGAFGLMQLMPPTAAELGVDPHNTFENALGGTKYLRSLLIRYHGDSALALAAYNAGPAAVDRFHGIPPYQETRNYVLRVLHEYEREHRSQSAHQQPMTQKSSALQSTSAAQ